VAERARWPVGRGGVVHTVFSDAADGDLAIGEPSEDLQRRRAALAPTPWTWLRQVHGAEVVRVAGAGAGAGEAADAAVTATAGAVLAVQVADCAPVLLWAPRGQGAVVAAAHAGWRGLLAGVLGATVAAMIDEGVDPTEVCWSLGPCICSLHYEFDGPEREALARRCGPDVAARTAQGAPALDLRAAVLGALTAEGVPGGPLGGAPPCTAESARHWSHRADGSAARQAGAIWWEPT
jgi:YfiH family protein